MTRLPLRQGAAVLAAVVLGITAASADVTIEQKTVSKGLGGFADGTSRSVFTVTADRSRSEDEFTYTGRFKTFMGKKPKGSVTITRLDRQLMWSLEPEKKEYREVTFAEMKAEMEKAAQNLKDAQAQQAQAQTGPSDQGMKFTIDVKRTGQKETINGFACEQVIVTCVGKPEKSEPGAENAELRFVLDQWMTPSVPGQDEVTGFYKRMGEALGIDHQFESMNAMAHQMYGHAMKEIGEKLKDVKGYAIRSTFRVEGPPATAEQQAAADQAKTDAAKAQEQAKANQAKGEKAQDAGDAATIGSEAAHGRSTKGSIGGFLGRKMASMMAKKAEAKAEEGASGATTSGGSLFETTTEVVSVSSTPAAAAGFEVPAGFKKVAKEK